MELWGVRSSLIRGKGAAWRRATGCMVAVTALALSGCSDQPAPSPTQTVQQTAAQPAATSTPMFASDEEALAAGVAAYQHLLDVEVKYVNGEAGAEEEYKHLVTEETWPDFKRSSDRLREAGARYVGQMKADPIKLQQVRQDSASTKVTFYACLDLTQVKVIDSAGQIIEHKSIDGRGYMLVDSVVEEGTIRISQVRQWSRDTC